MDKRWWHSLGWFVAHPYTAWAQSSTPVFLPLSLIASGAAAVIFGNDAALSFTRLGGSVAIRLIGAAMIVGSGMILVSFVRRNLLTETLGLTLASLGTAVYGSFTIVGFWPTHGLVSGIGYLGITAVLLNRVYLITVAVSAHQRLDEM